MYKVFLVALFVSFSINAQNDFGNITQSDIDLKFYEKDTIANAVVLYEKGDYKFQIIEREIFLIKRYDVKIKIFKEQGFDQANIEIPLYHNDNSKETAYDIKGMTHNGIVKTSLNQGDVFEENTGQNWSLKKFTLPNIKEGSVIQYSYKVKTPFFYNLDGWNFQSDIPKIYSEFNAEIPGIYYYNRSLYGKLPLSIKDISIKSNCFRPSIISREVNCEVIKYAMKDIPAFHDEEKYMLAPSNYIARLDFELATHYRLDGTKKNYTKTWGSVDSEFKKDKDIGRQLGKSSFFEKQLKDNNLKEGSKLSQATNIFEFVKNHFNWNGKYGIYKNVRVRDAFNEKIGNIGEINIALINMLNAADIKANLMLISTRKHGLPKKVQPVITDFNYVIAKTEIDGKTYLLDASEKLNPFGFLPFRCLNHYGRVMDFKEDSYWEDIIPKVKNKVVIRGYATLDPELGEINGKIREINQGYNAIAKYALLKSKTESEYLDDFESSSSSSFYIDNYTLEKDRSTEKLIMQSYDFVIEDAIKDNDIYLNPILIKFFTKNPFLREARNFPVDFGYPHSYEYSMTIDIPDNYEIATVPQNKTISLPNNQGLLDFNCQVNGKQLKLRFLLQLKDYYFEQDTYQALKTLFTEAVTIQKNSLVSIKKV